MPRPRKPSAVSESAAGRHASRPLTLFSRSSADLSLGDASRLRAPSARGPNSLRPSNQATTSPRLRDSAVCLRSCSGSSARAVTPCWANESSIIRVETGGPKKIGGGSSADSGRGALPSSASASIAAPNTVPPSLGATVPETWAYPLSRAIRRFIWAFSATPPESSRVSSPESRRSRWVIANPSSSTVACTSAANGA